MKEEKKFIKISLGTAICIVIIILLIIALLGMYFYYNKKDNPEIKQTNENVEKNNPEEKTDKEDNSKEEVKEKTNKSFNEGIYEYTGLNIEDKVMKAKEENKIEFSNNSFIADVGGFIIKGEYEVVNDNELKCILKSDMLKDDPNEKENYAIRGWTIAFNILDNKIKVKEYDFPLTEAEICTVLYNTFGQNQEFVKYEENEIDFIGTWNTKYYKDYKELKENLNEIFGTSIKYGSYLKLLENNKFEDYVYPIIEEDAHRKRNIYF